MIVRRFFFAYEFQPQNNRFEWVVVGDQFQPEEFFSSALFMSMWHV